METSNLIALGALIVAFIGLIPSFHQAFSQRNKDKKKSKTTKTKNNSIDKIRELDKSQDVGTEDKKVEDKPMPTMLRVIVLSLTGVIIGLIELIIFSGFAYFCDVTVDLATMSLVWKIVFYSLFVVPGIFFWFAFCTFTTMLTD
jgi:hypothetical protein